MEYRYAKQDCYCRECDKDLKRNVDKAIFIETHPKNIILCDDCVGKMFGLVEVREVDDE